MMVVFDTSSLMAVLLNDESPEVDVLFDQCVLDLTFYEAGNVLWKAHTLQDRIDVESRDRISGILEDLRAELTVETLEHLEFARVLAIATETDLTFYDAAYVTCAERHEARLVTEDQTLRTVADEYVSTIGLEELC